MSQTYALDAVPRNPYDHTRGLRISFAVGLAVPVGGIIWYFTTLPLAILLEPGQVVGLALVGLFAVLLLVGVAGLGPGAKSCTIDDDGFVLTFKKGRTRDYRWGDPKLRFRLEELRYKGTVTYSVSSGIPFISNLSADCYLRLLQVAQERGFLISTSTETSVGMTDITHRIRARSPK